ncbi:MAG: HIT domain-containing protein [Actinomycetota bacterium]|nr:HIT domain-containing protein [Actinomycetota bacterium]
MEHLWSPWRMEYIQGANEDPDGCIFCSIPGRTDDELVLARGTLAYVVLNKFPYNPGHLLVVPFRHTADVEDLTADENLELQSFLQRSVRALREEAEPHGFNIGMNLGRVAGAGIPDHVHWHVVPRWGGDTNFTTTIGATRVLPELLAETASKLAPRFAE